MSSWRSYNSRSGPLSPEVEQAQQEAIDRAAEAAERRVEAERAGKRSWWKRLWYWFRP